jgi:RNA polymerase sigma factor (TIGR02999 family)
MLVKMSDANESPTPAPASGADVEALAEMLPVVYQELRDLAGHYLRGERVDHTLQPTALVHEAYLRLRGQREVDWRNRAQFIGIAALMMRRVLKTHASARSAGKRGWDKGIRLALDEAIEFSDQCDLTIAAVDEALTELEMLDARQGKIVELRFFGGLTIEEISQLLDISPATIKREWVSAKRFLQRKLATGEG